MRKRKLNWKKMIGIIISVALLTVTVIGSAIVFIDSLQYKQNQKIIKTLQKTQNVSKSLVVFFSRSGNTELMANTIAQSKHAAIIPLRSQRDNIGFGGWIEALLDARKTTTEITPSKIDLSAYDTIYIGSPIWLYSPSPQIFEFVKNNDFHNKKIILFNSMNSKFEQKYIDDFKNCVEKNGGIFEKHIYIIRGRMTRQLDADSLIIETKRKLAEM